MNHTGLSPGLSHSLIEGWWYLQITVSFSVKSQAWGLSIFRKTVQQLLCCWWAMESDRQIQRKERQRQMARGDQWTSSCPSLQELLGSVWRVFLLLLFFCFCLFVRFVLFLFLIPFLSQRYHNIFMFKRAFSIEVYSRFSQKLIWVIKTDVASLEVLPAVLVLGGTACSKMSSLVFFTMTLLKSNLGKLFTACFDKSAVLC